MLTSAVSRLTVPSWLTGSLWKPLSGLVPHQASAVLALQCAPLPALSLSHAYRMCDTQLAWIYVRMSLMCRPLKPAVLCIQHTTWCLYLQTQWRCRCLFTPLAPRVLATMHLRGSMRRQCLTLGMLSTTRWVRVWEHVWLVGSVGPPTHPCACQMGVSTQLGGPAQAPTLPKVSRLFARCKVFHPLVCLAVCKGSARGRQGRRSPQPLPSLLP